ncbi:MAG: hypothetical protein JO027_00400 [Solirubrobacterales bacterium]|nr:hypothetical protein [Solirubrobacterales bacterium]
MSVRKVGLVIAALCAAMLIVPVAASAQTTPTTQSTPTTVTSLKSIAVTGKATNGKAFTGHYDITQFVAKNGKAYAVGTLTGKLGNRTVKQTIVAIPVSKGANTGLAHDAATCQILNLLLGPLHLNLLGLHVDLNQVILNVTGVTGTGQLLGNLLCGVANLLNPGLPAGELAGLLNIVQQILNVPGLASL